MSLMKDYGFIFKMKMTEVSNPMQKETKRDRGMSSKSFDLENIVTLSEMCRVLPGDDVLKKKKKDRMDFSSLKTCRSLTAECLLPPSLVGQRLFYWIQKYSEWISPQSFISRASDLLQERKGGSHRHACFVCCSLFPCILGYELASHFWDCFAES